MDRNDVIASHAELAATWATETDEVDRITDGLGARARRGIVDTVIALRLHGLVTWQSCLRANVTRPDLVPSIFDEPELLDF